MRLVYGSAVAVVLAMLVPPAIGARGQDAARAVAGGGISVPGWMGKADAGDLKDAKLTKEGNDLRVITGPAVTYWNPANKATGNYTVKATFKEAKYMNLNDHPHPYGIVIAGNDLGTPQQSLLYCEAYGNGTFIVRGFGPDAFSISARRPEANAAVHKAAGPGEPVPKPFDVAPANLFTADLRALAADSAAYDVGCASPQHFSTLFRRAAGAAPSAWRITARRRGR